LLKLILRLRRYRKTKDLGLSTHPALPFSSNVSLVNTKYYSVLE
jgi:hypothetical protein